MDIFLSLRIQDMSVEFSFNVSVNKILLKQELNILSLEILVLWKK